MIYKPKEKNIKKLEVFLQKIKKSVNKKNKINGKEK
jgi:hypothetical protein